MFSLEHALTLAWTKKCFSAVSGNLFFGILRILKIFKCNFVPNKTRTVHKVVVLYNRTIQMLVQTFICNHLSASAKKKIII